ncbi:PTS transporter subunit EIIC [[Clostridium] innocuum]|nr:PTS transporter subunit EIIC [[Clostridium] innocuum]
MFDMMIPMGLIVLVGWLGVQVGNIDVYAIIQEAFKPLTSFIQTLPGWILFDFALVFLYSLGISNWVLSPITEPVTLAAIAANVLMASEGVANASDLNMFTQELRFSTYMMIGGTGCTLPLVFMLLRAKSQKLKTMGRVGLVPSLFNINEPIVYGCIAWNPLLMIPMWLTAIILPCVIWVFTKIIAFAPIPAMVFNLWYCPYPVSTWLITRSINAILLMLICFVIAAMIYYPFFKVYDKQEYEQEQKALQK